MQYGTTWKNIYVTYMSKCRKYIFGKSWIIRIYFAYISFIKVRYSRKNIFEIYSNALEIYFRVRKCRIYILFS